MPIIPYILSCMCYTDKRSDSRNRWLVFIARVIASLEVGLTPGTQHLFKFQLVEQLFSALLTALS